MEKKKGGGGGGGGGEAKGLVTSLYLTSSLGMQLLPCGQVGKLQIFGPKRCFTQALAASSAAPRPCQPVPVYGSLIG